jgi:hypothetical protein
MKKSDRGTWLGDVSHFRRHSRREFLFTGLIGGLGLTLGNFFKLQAHAAQKDYLSREGVANSIIHIFLPGGVSAQESFDPKPFLPVNYRGPWGSIQTAMPGVRFGEHLKHTAKIADKLTICRSMTHGEAAHERGVHNMFTGYRPSPAVQYPSMGSVVSHEFGEKNNLPPYVCIPNQPNEYAGSGYLSAAYGPFGLGSDPAAKDFSVRDLALPDGISETRYQERRELLSIVDNHFRSLEKSDSLDAMDSFYQKAYGLISSEAARTAFDIKREPDKLRDEYGRNESGQRMILARRLVEAGVRFVSLTAGGWDHHKKIKDGIKKNLPNVDRAYARLIRDLEERGLLDSTVVMLTSEFGRTPKLNKDAGRDHYPRVFSVVLAGGGFKKGFVYGSSDATASAPDENPLSVPDFSTTIYNQLGIVADKELMAPGNRPIEIVKGGQVIKDLLA